MSKVSVIIPTYNRGRYIKQTIESVLTQTYSDYEIIVVDDGSTDNTREILQQFNGKVMYFYQNNKGTAAARNFGIRQAEGEYIAFLDDDDMWLPKKLEKQVSIMEASPEFGFVCSSVYVIDAYGSITDLWLKSRLLGPDSFGTLFKNNYVLILTVMVRKACLNEVGGFDERLKASEDYDLWLRLSKKFKFTYLNEPLANYRKHGENLSNQISLRLRDHLIIFNKREISRGIRFSEQRARIAKSYYRFAGQFYEQHKFYNAGICYCKAFLNAPLIGSDFRPKYNLKHKWRIFNWIVCNRIINVYYLASRCLLQSIIVRYTRVTI